MKSSYNTWSLCSEDRENRDYRIESILNRPSHWSPGSCAQCDEGESPSDWPLWHLPMPMPHSWSNSEFTLSQLNQAPLYPLQSRVAVFLLSHLVRGACLHLLPANPLCLTSEFLGEYFSFSYVSFLEFQRCHRGSRVSWRAKRGGWLISCFYKCWGGFPVWIFCPTVMDLFSLPPPTLAISRYLLVVIKCFPNPFPHDSAPPPAFDPCLVATCKDLYLPLSVPKFLCTHQ